MGWTKLPTKTYFLFGFKDPSFKIRWDHFSPERKNKYIIALLWIIYFVVFDKWLKSSRKPLIIMISLKNSLALFRKKCIYSLNDAWLWFLATSADSRQHRAGVTTASCPSNLSRACFLGHPLNSVKTNLLWSKTFGNAMRVQKKVCVLNFLVTGPASSQRDEMPRRDKSTLKHLNEILSQHVT